MKIQGFFLAGAITALVMTGTINLAAAQSSTSIDETLRVGVITESGSNDDQMMLEAALLAAEDINEDGGVLAPDNQRYGFEIMSYEATTSQDVLDALSDAVNDNAVAIIGPNDASFASALDDAGRPAVPVLLGESDSPTGNYLYRIAPDYGDWATAAANYLTDVRYFDRIALLTVETESADTARSAFNQAVAAEKLVADLRFDPETTDFTAQAQTVKDADTQALFVWALSSQVQNLQTALDQIRWDGVIIYGGLRVASIQSLTAAHPENLFGLSNWTNTAYDATSQRFVTHFEAAYATLPSQGAAAGYDALHLITAAVDANGSQPASIANWLGSVGALEGVFGSYDRGVSSTVRLVQYTQEGSVEAARFDGDDCADCAEIWVEDTSEQDTNDTATFRIGLIAATNSPNQPLAENIEQATRLAIRDINAAGGALAPDGTRYTFSLNVYDATTADEASSAMENAAADGVKVVLGPNSNEQVLENLGDAENASIIQLVSATSDTIALDESSNYVFQIRPTDDALARTAADYIANTYGATRIATVAVNTDYGIDAIEAFTDALADTDDGEIILSLEHAVEDTEMGEMAQQIVEADADSVAVWSTQPAALSLLDALTQANWQGTFVYGYLTPGFVEASADSAIPVIAPVNWWDTAKNWTSRDFATRYQDRYNAEPLPQSAAYYDAVYLIQQAVTEQGGEVSDVQEWIVGEEAFLGVQGNYAPEVYGTGELTRSVLMVQALNGSVSQVSHYDDGVCIVYCGD